MIEIGQGLSAEITAAGKIKISITKVPIETNTNSFLMTRDNDWKSDITITNFAQLKNVTISSQFPDNCNVTVTLDNGLLHCTTTQDYRYNWLLDDFPTATMTITADNAKQPLNLGFSTNSEGRIAIATTSYSYGIYLNGSGKCGVIEVGKALPFEKLSLTLNVETGTLQLKNVELGYVIGVDSVGMPPAENGTVYVSGNNGGVNYLTAIATIGKINNGGAAHSCPISNATLPTS